MSLIQTISEHKVVAIIRKADENNIIPILKALDEGGVKAVEITAETPRITNLIEKAVAEYGGKIGIGAGTVLDPETARAVIMAGAEFIVSPTLNTETLKLTNRYGVLNIPGALTPTEIVTAYEHGAGMVKVFPADAFGPKYMKNVHGPLPHIPLMATGGVTLDNMNEFIAHGSKAVGIGSNLVNVSKLHTREDYDNLALQASRFVTMQKELNLS
ncbi:bifunctional 4-hydroxy-2-oxoglutarate aldolase/2-dehydro-3-deoxy-phosphogluconate aldolase [Gracilibacillus sp. YIM 98692]|uniref:bifunctional 4-hydroxy-2-oxoglutarate aldolase/2-dehydro-3-deoxy-phosphogluconate aldolase n=1 Tax=Gracilibacillus sp. YIM 98692 TaxID=2663532 RepID=UPI0013CF4130|nr:bifunctional 4-hydroxy-2-oxoglutarate aldolase/2-dehydro-3-deoxy-phosphogluconate aldolase [Gracilibacillus sp. YIM 98692]